MVEVSKQINKTFQPDPTTNTTSDSETVENNGQKSILVFYWRFERAEKNIWYIISSIACLFLIHLHSKNIFLDG